MKNIPSDRLHQLCNNVRQDIVKMSYKAQVGHVGSAFSVVEILVALYFGVLRINPNRPSWKMRDRFILSKGHAANALYPVLVRRGYFPKKILDTYCQNGGFLGEHPESHLLAGIEHPTGSLGHGLSVAAGIALAAKIDRLSFRSFVLLSDAECNEGAIWEAALFSQQQRLDNLIAVIDYNKVQAFGTTFEVLNLEPFRAKWQAFGWEVVEVNGHDINQLIAVLNTVPRIKNKPSVIIAHTIRGKSVSFMENKLEWHYLSPTKTQYQKAMKTLRKNHA